MAVLDVGCGPGSISVGLAEAVGPRGRVLGVDAEPSQARAATEHARRCGAGNARFVVASAYALPVAEQTVDGYFSHALFEHLNRPVVALEQARRVLRPGGLLALAASDWSRARFDPYTEDVKLAMTGHYQLRRRAGGDPFAGGWLGELTRSAGFEVIAQVDQQWVDFGYAQLAAYVGARLANASRADPGDETLKRAVAAATRWGRANGSVSQCWVHVLARSPRRASGMSTGDQQ